MISESYRELNRRLHAESQVYGAGHSSSRWFERIRGLIDTIGARSIIDWGCGKGAFGAAVPHLMVEGYDPAIPGKDELPEPADLVVCTDVMEHVEPEFIDEVLDRIAERAIRGVFFTVATRPAQRILSDGRNAHISLHGSDWWVPKLMARWEMVFFSAQGGEFAFYGTARASLGRELMAA